MYSLTHFGRMIADRVRIDAYRAAIQAAVRPGDTVVDIGAGTGILTLFACQAGAERVYAVDPNPAIQIAEETVRTNGFSDRVTIVRGLSTELELERPADVVVSDIRGILPYFEHHLATIDDARTRLLRPGGALIPQRDRLWGAPVEYRSQDFDLIKPWEGSPFGLDLSGGARYIHNMWVKSRFTREELLAEPLLVSTLDYVAGAPHALSAELEWPVLRPALLTGVGVWFDTELFDGIGFTNAPGAPEALYGRGFFPVLNRVDVTPGDVVRASLGAWPVDGDYVWRWQTSVLHRDRVIAESDHSTFWSEPLRLDRVRRSEARHVPKQVDEMGFDAFVLSQVDGRRSLGDLARMVREVYPGRFETDADALKAVSRVTLRYPE